MIDTDIRNLSFPHYLEAIRAFTDEELIPSEDEMVDAGEVPPRIVGRMAEIGLFGITLPASCGGLGWNVEQQVLLTLEFTRASCVFRSRFSTVIGLTSQAILEHGTEAQRARYLPAMASGELVTAFALSEPGAGSDASNLSTVARRTAKGYELHGRKRFITNGAWADELLVFARVHDGHSLSDALTAFMIPRDQPHVETTLPSRMNGHAEGPVAQIDLDGVGVSHEAVLGGVEGQGLKQALRGINHARIHVAATAVGQASRMLTEATAHSMRRHQFGSAIADLGVVEAKIGRSFAEIEAGRALVLDCAREFDRSGFAPRERISAAKLYCTEMASQVGDRAVQMLGGDGIVGDHPVPRMWRDVRALRIYEGASEIHERNLARFVKRRVDANSSTTAVEQP